MDEERNETKRRFTLKNKKPRIAGAIYIALAICVVTVMVLSIYSINTKFGDLSEPDTSIPEVSGPGDHSNPENSEIPTEKEQSGVPDETKALYVLPVTGETIKGFTMTSLIYSKTMKDYRTHAGIDIAGELGDAVKCYSNGYVTAVRTDEFMGMTVEVAHGHGLKSVYQNLDKDLPETVYVGAEVKAGDIIGAIGDTAIIEAADPPHLHFELLLDGAPINSERELQTLASAGS